MTNAFDRFWVYNFLSFDEIVHAVFLRSVPERVIAQLGSHSIGLLCVVEEAHPIPRTIVDDSPSQEPSSIVRIRFEVTVIA